MMPELSATALGTTAATCTRCMNILFNTLRRVRALCSLGALVELGALEAPWVSRRIRTEIAKARAEADRRWPKAREGGSAKTEPRSRLKTDDRSAAGKPDRTGVADKGGHLRTPEDRCTPHGTLMGARLVAEAPQATGYHTGIPQLLLCYTEVHRAYNFRR